jgi:hypothetical protein
MQPGGGGPPPGGPPFRNISPDINVGPDLGGTGQTAVNITGSAGPAGGTWIALYDTTPTDPSTKNLFGNVNLGADVLMSTFNNKKGGGLLALYNEGVGEKGLALILFDKGNTDTLVLATVDQAGKLTPLQSVSMGAGIAEQRWYRVTMDVVVSGGSVTVTGKVFRHMDVKDPDSALGTQVGGTLSFSSLRPAGVDATGQVGIISSATSANASSSVTNFMIDGTTVFP